jgi:Ca2+/Na+ antiporter
MLPALPVAIAAWLVAGRRSSGDALGSILGASVWVLISLVWVVRKDQDPAISAHIVVLVLLLASMVGVLVAAPETRERVHANGSSRALLACALVVAAVILRVQSRRIASAITSTDKPPTDWPQVLSSPPFWISTLVPVLICLPAALLLFNRVQTRALVTLVSLQVLYPAVLRAMTFSERTDEGVLPVITEDVIFLAGSLCMILAVWAGQRRSAHPT